MPHGGNYTFWLAQLLWSALSKGSGMKTKLLRTLALSASVLLIGCATSDLRGELKGLIASGRCSEARQRANVSIDSPGLLATVLGAIYCDCDRDRDTGVRFLALGARYGDEDARRILTGMGKPVPRADLASASHTRSSNAFGDLMVAALQGYMAGRAAAPQMPPPPVWDTSSRQLSCSSVVAGVTVQTTCR